MSDNDASTHSAVLPSELPNLCIDALALQLRHAPVYLKKNSLRSLLTCSAVSKEFSLQSRKHIFASIDLSEGNPTRVSTFCDILSWTPAEDETHNLRLPRLIQYITSLWLAVLPKEDPSRSRSLTKMLHRLFQLLSSQKQDIKSEHLGVLADTEMGVHEEVKEPLVNLIRSLPLSTLALHCIWTSTLPNDFLVGTNIRHIWLHDSDVAFFTRRSDSETMKYPLIETLRLTGKGRHVVPVDSSNGAIVPRVRRLRMNVAKTEDFTRLIKVFNVSPYFEALELSYNRCAIRISAPPTFSLPTLKNFRTLVIRHPGSEQNHFVWDQGAAVSDLTSFFKTIKLPASLISLELRFSQDRFADVSLPESGHLDETHAHKWADIGQALSTATCGPLNVTITLERSHSRGDTSEEGNLETICSLWRNAFIWDLGDWPNVRVVNRLGYE